MLIDDPGAFMAAFAASATYTASGAGASIQAMVEECQPWPGIHTLLRDSYGHGQVPARHGLGRPVDLPATPAFGHSIEQDGRAWTVQDAWPEGDMLVLGLAVGVFVVDVTVQKDAEVSDGALGHTTAPVDIWTGQAAVHGLGGKERLMAAREVGVGYRTGWMPACPALAAGCRIVTPHEVLHVTHAFTDRDRGWTSFEAEARQEEQG